MKQFAVQIFFLFVLIVLALAYQTGKLSNLNLFPASPTILRPNEPTKQTEVLIKDIKIKVELANTSATRAKGLGGRQRLATDSGMLFVFDKPDYHIFWMKGMKFALDFIWIKDKKVVDITKNAPAPAANTPDSVLAKYPTKPILVDSVLEVNSGFADANSISIGDSIEVK